VNDAPVANNDSYTTNEDTTLNGNVLSNDTDVDTANTALTASIVDGPAHGALNLNANGTFTYTPTANYNGTDTFTYRTSDGSLISNLATVNISITPVNDVPVAANDSYTTNEDTALTISAPGVLTNDTDADGNSLTASVVTGPGHGALSLNGNGSFTYTPAADYNGTDTFTYKVNDGTADSNTATVTMTINPVNDAPVAVNDSYTTNEDTALNGNVLSNDTDADAGTTLHATVVNGPSNGQLVLNDNGSFTYTPSANWNGSDSFTYKVNDGTVDGNTAIVNIAVTPVNDPVQAVNDTNSGPEDGGAITGNVLTNDNATNVDVGETLTVSPASGTTTNGGTWSINGVGAYTYSPALNFNGTDSFNYTVSDASTSSVGTVTITVTPVNDAPVAGNDAYSLPTNGTLTTTAGTGVLANDTDVENSPLTAVLVSGPAHGTLNLNPNGSFTYTPTSAYSGSDTFTYRASDGTTTGNIATVTITDTIAPTATDVQTTNGGGTNGLLQQSDTITYTFSEPIDPTSILAGWDGSATNVTVRAYDGNILLGLLGGNDSLQIYNANNNALLPLGAVELGRTDYVTGLLGGTITFGAPGEPVRSTMTLTSPNTVTVTLGTYDSVLLGAVRNTAGGNGTMTWTPSAGVKDLAGNSISTATSATEFGSADKDF
jgi:VCBS repeat-containing protein